MQIRALTPEDARTYRELRLRSLKESPHAFSSAYEIEKDRPLEVTEQRLHASEHQFTLGCFTSDDELIGMVTFVRESSPKLMHKGNVYAMYVAPHFREKKVGSALLRELIERAEQFVGLEQINLTVVSGNAAAKTLYESFGFTVYGIERNALIIDGQYWDEDMMVLRLQN